MRNPGPSRGNPRKVPSAPKAKSLSYHLSPQSCSHPQPGLAPHNCLNIATYPVPAGPPRARLPLPGSSQQGRTEDTLLGYSVSSTQGQVWGQTSGLLELMLCALSLLQLPSRLIPRASSGSGVAKRIIRGSLGMCSPYSFLQLPNTTKTPCCLCLP